MIMDRYTKIILTIIAIALVLNLFQPILLKVIRPTVAEAQMDEEFSGTVNVTIVGIETNNSLPIEVNGALPVVYNGEGEGLPVVVMKPIHIYQ